MNGTIEHTAIVVDVMPGRVDVVVLAEEACGSCKVKDACSMGQTKEKEITIYTEVAQYFEKGENVVVSVESSMGMKAVTIAYIVPFFLMLVVLFLLIGLGVTEAKAGIASLVAVGLYFGGVTLFRKRIDKEITFKINKI